jgi:hypothetical protein
LPFLQIRSFEILPIKSPRKAGRVGLKYIGGVVVLLYFRARDDSS